MGSFQLNPGEKMRMLHTDADYQEALREDAAMDPDTQLKHGSPEYDKAHALVVAITVWEYMHGIKRSDDEADDATR